MNREYILPHWNVLMGLRPHNDDELKLEGRVSMNLVKDITCVSLT